MMRSVCAFLLLVLLSPIARSAAADEVTDGLARAQALYYEARFTESVQLLLRLDELLRPQPARIQEKTAVKLQLALAHVGLNDTVKAKSFLRELYSLDPDHVLDTQQYSPKVMGLALQAKTEQDEIRCQAAQTTARKELDAGNAKASLDLIGAMKARCSALTALEPELAELFYKSGFDAYKRGDLPKAIQSFETTLKIVPKHDLATQYIDLTQSKLQLSADRLFLQWQKNFDARDFAHANEDFHRLEAFNDEANAQMIVQIKNEYRKTLNQLVDAWNRSCASGNQAEMNSVGKQISDMLPDPSFAEDILGKMATCTKNGCIQMGTSLAMARLKTKVNPEFSPGLQDFLRGAQMTIRVKGKIDEGGSFTVTETEGSNPSVNAAVTAALGRWKFSPIIDQSGTRCVDTEIPIVLRF
jgi:hypothetical protein